MNADRFSCFRILCGITLFLLTASGANASEAVGIIPFDSPRWQMEGGRFQIEEHLGRPAIHLQAGSVLIEDVEFLDGIIEFDIAFTGARGFVGAVFRVEDGANYEHFYLRPHQSGMPDANQYTPVFNGVASWQLYHGDGYGAPVDYTSNQWMAVRIVVSGSRAEAFINDSVAPAVVIHELKRKPRPGKIGLSVGGGFASAHFSNFKYQLVEKPELRGKAKKFPSPGSETVQRVQVSRAFSESMLAGKTMLDSDDKPSRGWTPLTSEATGLFNLSRIQGLVDGRDTVFARVVLSAETEKIQELVFGYSDKVRVFLNDRLIYSGDNSYRSRDYRFLGTIGHFDRLHLPLRSGSNELLFAVTESFGGWGVLARLPESAGLTVGSDQ